jgi:hypothetical protein
MNCTNALDRYETELRMTAHASRKSRVFSHCISAALFAVVVLAGCQSGPPPARESASQEWPAVAALPVSDVRIAAVALAGPVLELAFIQHIERDPSLVYAAPIAQHRAPTVCARRTGWRVHIVLSLSGPPAKLENIASFVHSQSAVELLIDVFDAASGQRLTATERDTHMIGIYEDSDFALAQPKRAAWEQTLMTSELGLRVLIIPIDLVAAPSPNGLVRVSLQRMAESFRAWSESDVLVMVDTCFVELGLHSP